MGKLAGAHHYGYIKRTEGADGDHVDVFIGPDTDSQNVYVIDQVNADGTFDEHKVMLGFRNQKAARDGYRANYEKGWKVGPATKMTMDQFKDWLAEGDTTKPVSDRLHGASAKRPKRPSKKAADTGNDPLFSLAKSKSLRAAWQPNFPKAVMSLGAKEFQKHPDYRAAKEGDIAVAVRLAKGTLKEGDMVKIRRLAQGVKGAPILMPVHAEEAVSVNQVPMAASAHIGKELGGDVIGVVALNGKQYSSQLAPISDTLETLRKRWPELEGWWNEQFGYGFDQLTESEARYLARVRVPSPDALRDRILAARQTRVAGGSPLPTGRDGPLTSITESPEARLIAGLSASRVPESVRRALWWTGACPPLTGR